MLLGFKVRTIWNHSKEYKMLNYTDVDSIFTTMSCDSMGFLLNLPEISLLHLENGNKLTIYLVVVRIEVKYIKYLAQ